MQNISAMIIPNPINIPRDMAMTTPNFLLSSSYLFVEFVTFTG